MMTWKVWYYNINKREIEEYNVFNHGSFRESLRQLVEDECSYETFVNQLNSNARYYFWGRCEWEIVLVEWPGGSINACQKIDVYEQLRLNWDAFVRYAWENRASLIG
jgi:hypothetical protein